MIKTRPADPAGKKNFSELDFVGLCDRLAEKKPTLIIFHAHPDGDAVGSAFSLGLLLGAAGSPAFCVCADDIPGAVFAVEGFRQAFSPSRCPETSDTSGSVGRHSSKPRWGGFTSWRQN